MKTKKILRIKKLINRLQNRESVSSRALSRVLEVAQLKNLASEWEEEKSFRRVLKPLVLKKYEALIKNALCLYGRGDKMCFLKRPAHKISAIYQKAQSLFLDAFFYLEEVIEKDPNVQLWIDRDLQDVSYDPIGIPRVIGSSSPECRNKNKSPFPSLTKRQLKIQALEQALEALEPKPIEGQDKSVTFLCPPRKAHNFDGFVF